MTQSFARFELAARAHCRAVAPDFPKSKKGEAALQAHVDTQWPTFVASIEAAYTAWEAHQNPLRTHSCSR